MPKASISQKQLGVLGEKVALNYLKKKGYKILDKNYSFNWGGSCLNKGEIDIIAKKGDVISFIEVKTIVKEPENENFEPEDRVDFLKQRKLEKIAQIWLDKNKIPLETEWQIDIIGIKIDLDSKKAKIRHLKDVVY